jgi:hypothetical protein
MRCTTWLAQHANMEVTWQSNRSGDGCQIKMEKQDFGLSLPQKISYTLLLVLLSLLAILVGPRLQTGLFWILFLAIGVALGLVSFFVSAGWTYRINMQKNTLHVFDKRREITVPLEKIGMVVRNGGFPFPTLWLVLRNAEVGTEIPVKGVDPLTRSLIENYQRRNPGKKVTMLQIPGGYLRSVSGFAREIKRRIPPVAVDERLAK